MPLSSAQKGCWVCVSITGLLLLCILLPLSFSYLDYYEYGLVQRKSTGSVDTSKVYARGRYALGPDRTFLKYKADAHHEAFDNLSVFSSSEEGSSNSSSTAGDSVGLAFEVDIDLTYLLIKDEVGDLHRELATSYQDIIRSRAREAVKNQAINVTFTQYFQDRKRVEQIFRDAVQARWNTPPSVHCTLDQFHLGRITIPETVAKKQLEAQLQTERNQKELFVQEAQVEREFTKVDVNAIGLQTAKVLATAHAEADLLMANANVNAARIVQEAQINGTQALFVAAGITNQEQKTSFMYIRALTQRDALNLPLEMIVSHWDPTSVARVIGL